MEVFTLTRETHPCACGGRHSNIPDIIRRHGETKKHSTWLFRKLSEELLALPDRQSKVLRLMKMRDLLRAGRVKD